MTKICVYVICKNELKFVRDTDWLHRVLEADKILMLDTGSTDGTYEYLKEIEKVNDKLVVYRKEYGDSFRFDVARNDALDLAFDDKFDVYVSVDCDEFFEQGWSNHIREAWIKNKYERVEYWYSHGCDAYGNPKDIYRYNKIHSAGWRWSGAVHEYLFKPGFDEYSEHTAALDLFDKIKLYHRQDFTKPREYFELLKVRAEEENDINCRFYLGGEYMQQGDYEEALKIFFSIVVDNRSDFDNFCAYSRIAECYLYSGDKLKAIKYILRCLEMNDTYRNPWFLLAEIYGSMELWATAIKTIEMALVKTYNHQDWFETGEDWNGREYDLLSLYHYYNGNYKQSYENVCLALERYPNDERIINNKILIERELKEDNK